MSNELAAFGSASFTPAISTKKKTGVEKGYAPRLQLVSTGNSKVVNDGNARAGDFIVVDGKKFKDNIGKNATIVLLGKLYKAVDFSGDEVETSFDPESEAYQRIANELAEYGFDSQCMVGALYLGYLVETEQFVELYLNSKSLANEEDNLDEFVPVGPELAEQLGIDPRPPQIASLKSRFIEGKRYSWHVFDTTPGPESLEGVEPPANEIVQQALANFYKQANPDAGSDEEESSRER